MAVRNENAVFPSPAETPHPSPCGRPEAWSPYVSRSGCMVFLRDPNRVNDFDLFQADQVDRARLLPLLRSTAEYRSWLAESRLNGPLLQRAGEGAS